MAFVITAGDSKLGHITAWPIAGLGPNNLALGGVTAQDVIDLQLPALARLQVPYFMPNSPANAGLILAVGTNDRVAILSGAMTLAQFVANYTQILQTLVDTL